jgi:hypothetical protein
MTAPRGTVFSELLRSHRSIRAFKTGPIDPVLVDLHGDRETKGWRRYQAPGPGATRDRSPETGIAPDHPTLG